ncbi:glycosyltransferase family 4 protein [Wansuia hejianensis]|uniref:Undecaprenyl/decaprenyl-phosphate alpha-N-acetylglucosaminyl 1-phosphate transferase n=1 Tax=Wansuia hejianensis TaxID=2763667 RepID=A0A926ILG1_9FIRM|nr:undecaprenyl/decaprenyl-phosphate alpha-N-acetylglucosaminyl 1-phosphate transferase [Wansuia hejianensis]MBC8590099.1 undecaprenyl/decaprenyl-phosphate alpha-N-acetylglucosaminyl 1-phosphate transferase [Wansuia hejianensis]
MENFIMPFCISAFISLLMTPLVKKLAWKIGAVDIPKDGRRIHRKAMPLIGGLAIYIGVIITSIIYLPLDRFLISMIIGSTIIVISGIIDDIKELSPRLKLIFQLMSGLVLILGDVRIDFIRNPFSNNNLLLDLKWLSIPITLFWCIGIINTFNLIDGLDGLAAGVAFISSFSLILVAGRYNYTNIIILSSIVAGACIGFLPFNFNPARIFMGDTGSLFLGFMLASISIEGVMKSVTAISIVVPIMILGIPIFDTTFAIIRRFLSGKSIMDADKGHLHHRLMNRGYGHRDTVLILYSISIIFGAFSVIMADANSKRAFLASIALFIMSLFIAMKLGLFKKDRE